MVAAVAFTLTDADDLTGLLDAVEAFGDAEGLPMKTVMTLNLLLEELVTNAIQYGAGPDGAKVSVRAELRGGAVHAAVRDNGSAFNPLLHEAPDLDASIDDRPIGGLGLHIVRQMAQNPVYERQGTENVLTFELTIEEG
ncbi:ATP-binding protein [Acuticoccus yangtzensis]|uniref:ATP-binding protein n=1 Tax=Acuticoccus yangtzensis TaxID=1443441 RepID=UPI0009495E83|nr:ATP-binding protein [Acuticoccus yangtzensis]ORE93024.1 anti-sigma regulatory factor, serine/threonine protein kinase [Stappia sp. 22II-S9-Z10]